MELDPIQTDARRTARREKLGSDACCVLCGESQWESLTKVKRSLLEAHHVVARANDEKLTAVLCRNCHGKLHESMRQVGASTDQPQTLLDRLIAILRGLATFFQHLGELLLDLALRLPRFIAALDREFPTWRAMPEAR